MLIRLKKNIPAEERTAAGIIRRFMKKNVIIMNKHNNNTLTIINKIHIKVNSINKKNYQISQIFYEFYFSVLKLDIILSNSSDKWELDFNSSLILSLP